VNARSFSLRSRTCSFPCLTSSVCRWLLPGLFGFFIERQGFVLKRFGLIENRKTMTGFVLEFRRVVVVPAVRGADSQFVVLPGRADNV
jgi:hypothetical protein